MFTPPIRAIYFLSQLNLKSAENSKAGDYNLFICISKRLKHSKALTRAGLALALFMPRVLADHAHDTLPANDFAVAANFLNGRQYFHNLLLNPLTVPTWRGK